MADLGKITPTKPAWSRVGETLPEDNGPQHQPQPENENENDKKRDSDETPEKSEKPSDPDDEHQIDLFV